LVGILFRSIEFNVYTQVNIGLHDLFFPLLALKISMCMCMCVYSKAAYYTSSDMYLNGNEERNRCKKEIKCEDFLNLS